MFFDLMNVALVNPYRSLRRSKLHLVYFRTVIANLLIGSYNSSKS